MNAAQLTTALVFAQTCGGGSTPAPSTDSPESVMVLRRIPDHAEVETRYGGGCETDDECTVVLDGTGDDCESTNLPMADDFDTEWFYATWDEARSFSCEIEFETSGVCDPTLEPTCAEGKCAWR